MSVIAVGGLSGGGGRVLGPVVAERLGTDYVDRLVLTDVARRLGATVEALHQREERPPSLMERTSRIIQRMLDQTAATASFGDSYLGTGVPAFLTDEFEDLPQAVITRGHEVEDEVYIEAISGAIHDLATTGNVVIVGRGSHVILRDMPNVLRIGVVANHEDRLATIMSRENLSKEEAEITISARDKARAYFFKRFFKIENPDSPDLYHQVINSSEMSLSHCAEIVVKASSALKDGSLSHAD